MPTSHRYVTQLRLALQAAFLASDQIMTIYNEDFGIDYKKDHSPITEADRKGHAVINEILDQSGLPVLSEEGKKIEWTERKKWESFWLVDPVDGTKEFIRKNGEFTINIALISKQSPVLGVVYAPAVPALFIGIHDSGSFALRIDADIDQFRRLIGNDSSDLHSFLRPYRIPNLSGKARYFTIVASRSHLNALTQRFISELEKSHAPINSLHIGSSLKLCLVAEGRADIYPRFGPTSEWDTAAADAVARAAGMVVRTADENGHINESPLLYNKHNILNPYFIIARPGVL